MAINSGDISQVYQNALGRSPTAAETNSFMQYANNGSVPLTSFDLQQIVQGTPEYQQQQLQNYGQQFQNTLGTSDSRILGISQNNVMQQFASQGRNAGSSGYLNAYANAAANLAMSRQQQLANFYGTGYTNILGSGTQQANASQGNAISQQNSALGFQRQMQLYQQQQTDYQNWANSQQRKGLGLALTGRALDVLAPSLSNSNSLGGGNAGGGGGGYPGYTNGGGAGGGYTSGYGSSFSSAPGYIQGFGGYGGYQGTTSSMANKGASSGGLFSGLESLGSSAAAE